MTSTPLPFRPWLRAAIVVACLAAGPSHAATDQAPPKLVLVLVVDGLPSEQVQRYRDQFGEGGFRRLLDQGASFSNAHQAHGITVTAVGHTAVLTGAYPYQHGIIGNNWVDPVTNKQMYCTEDTAHTYIGEQTRQGDGTSPANLRVDTLGDQLRYASGNRAKVITVAGKDRGAILLAGKTGTAYMYIDNSGNFASSTYYMPSYPAWVQKYRAAKPQDRYYGKSWTPLLADAAYAGDAGPELYPASVSFPRQFPIAATSSKGKPDAEYYLGLKTGPFLDEMTLDFARAAVDGENLGSNPAGVPDLLGVSLSAHDYVNHRYGPESKMSHDHLQRLDRMLAGFFDYLDRRIGMDNVLVVLTADHGFANTPEFAQSRHLDAHRLEGKKLVAALDQHLAGKYGAQKLVSAYSLPNIHLDNALIEQKGLKRADVEQAAARFLQAQAGVAQVYTRSQFEAGALPATRMSLLMQRAWNRQLSGDLVVVTKPFWFFAGAGETGASHGTPYAYDSNVPLLLMGKRWITPGAYGQYAEVVDIVPTLAHLLHLRPPAAAEGRVLTETVR
jgi:predicted AlkP superfamily pyrophosphatase or phosphodiesterase